MTAALQLCGGQKSCHRNNEIGQIRGQMPTMKSQIHTLNHIAFHVSIAASCSFWRLSSNLLTDSSTGP